MDEKIKKCIEITKCLKKDKSTGHSFHTTFIFEKGKLLIIGFNNCYDDDGCADILYNHLYIFLIFF